MTTQVCRSCKQEKEISDFYTYQYKDKSKKGGIMSKCKYCTLLSSKNKHTANFKDKNIIQDLPNETWEDVLGYEGCYMVSSMGRIKSLYRLVNCKRGGKTQKQSRILKEWTDDKGYVHVTLSKEGKNKRHSVHQVVAKAFIPNPLNLEGVNHGNYIKNDNRKENLVWMTNPDNAKDAWDNNKVPYQIGFDASNVSFTKEQVIDIYHSELSVKELSNKYNRPYQTIYYIKSGRVFKEITNGVSNIKNKINGLSR